MDYKTRILYKSKGKYLVFSTHKSAFKGFNNIIKLPVKYNVSHRIMDGFCSKNFWKNMYFNMKHPIMQRSTWDVP